jgi:polyisoprenyl-phosphate glycosyltransferase
MDYTKKIQIIIPCHNEEENIEIIIKELDKYLSYHPYQYELVFIDDGSTDNTYNVIKKISQNRSDLAIIKLSRNFGKEAAIAAGLRNCEADAVIVIDSDLQHPPDLIPSMINEWENGVQVVDAVKRKRQKENFLTRAMSLFFNQAMNILTGMDFKGASDYKLLDKSAIVVLNSIDEKTRFFRGLTNWIGMRHSKIEYQVQERKSGSSKWNWIMLFQLSIDALSSYSSKPLHIVTFLGIFTFIFSIILGLQTLYNWSFGYAVSGFTTVILVVLIFSSIIMISIGIIGIYISKIYNEVKNRPIYVIESKE